MDLLTSTDILPQKWCSRQRLPHVVTERKEEKKYGVKTQLSTNSATCGQQVCPHIINTCITFGYRLVSLREIHIFYNDGWGIGINVNLEDTFLSVVHDV